MLWQLESMFEQVEQCSVFQIPYTHSKSLPSPDLSITALLNFKLPPTLTLTTPILLSAHDMITLDLATATLRYIPIPPIPLLLELAASAMLGEGTQTVQCPYAPCHQKLRFSLWIITFWTKATIIIKTYKEPWEAAVALLHQRRDVAQLKGAQTIVSLLTDSAKALSAVKWSGNIHGIERGTIPTLCLTTFLSQD